MPFYCFPFQKTFGQEMLLDLVEKTKQNYVLSVLVDCVFVTIIFDSWMSKRAHDVLH
jgi:hypothetical protein